MTLARVKAEVVLAVQLATRHRTVRLIAALGALVLAAGWFDRSAHAGTVPTSVHLVPGAIAVVAASRVLAPGAAVASAERAANAWWMAPLGRLVGVALIAMTAASVAVGTSVSGEAASTRLLLVVTVQAVALSGIVLMLAPLFGASAAGAVGLLLALLGPLPPSRVGALLPDGTAIERMSVLAWNVLPLTWRGMRASNGELLQDGALLMGWIAIAVLGAGWATVPSGFWADGHARVV